MKKLFTMNRRQYLKAALTAPMALHSQTPSAQNLDFPSRPVKVTVPFAPGGSVDQMARYIGGKLLPKWGQSLVVESRPGANSLVGTTYVARAPADGYNILMAADPAFSIIPVLNKNMPYNPDKDFAPLSIMCQISFLIVAHGSFPANNFQEMVAYAKANPGKVSYSTPGIGSQHHVMFEVLANRLGIDLLHIPYQGIAPSMAALLSGEVNLLMGALALPLPHIRSGRIKAIAFAGEGRHPLLPQVPTIAQSGGLAFEARSWFGAFAPSATPKDIVQKMSNDIWDITSSKDFSENYLIPNGYDPINTIKPAQFAKFLQEDRAKWEKAIALIPSEKFKT
jgi:tripartite-type tricarboxylate transporter receptor subunit TctC